MFQLNPEVTTVIKLESTDASQSLNQNLAQ